VPALAANLRCDHDGESGELVTPCVIVLPRIPAGGTVSVNILQLTDLHLTTDPDGVLKGVPTYPALLDVLEFIDRLEESAGPRFDAIVITGDLAHDEEAETYDVLREALGDRLPRCRFVPGNHDDRKFMRRVLGDSISPRNPYVTFSFGLGGWRLIGLDSHVKGEVPGWLDERQIDWLAEELERHTQELTILFIHHPPFAIGSPWLDPLGLKEPAALMEVVRTHPQVRVISAGHVHQAFDGGSERLRLLTTPSTAVQFAPRVEQPEYQPIPPGFRVFSLDGDRYDTHVIRLPELKHPPSS
jgi:Icc protein